MAVANVAVAVDAWLLLLPWLMLRTRPLLLPWLMLQSWILLLPWPELLPWLLLLPSLLPLLRLMLLS